MRDSGKRVEEPDDEEKLRQAARTFQAWTRHAPEIAAILEAHLPELGPTIDAQREQWLHRGASILISSVLRPFLLEHLSPSANDEALRRAFAAIEEIANHPLELVAALHLTVIIELWTYPWLLERARPLMGPLTAEAIDRYAIDWAENPRAQAEHASFKERVCRLPRGTDMRPNAYPTVDQLWRGAILRSIASAFFSAGADDPYGDVSWAGPTYVHNDGSGGHGAITFDGDRVVGGFHYSKSDRDPHGERYPYEPRLFIEGLPPELEELAEQDAFGFLLESFRGRTIPMITAVIWSEGGRLVAPEPWDDLMEHCNDLIREHVLDLEAALDWLTEDYDLTDSQVGLVRTLFQRRLASGSDPVFLTPAEAALISREGRATQEETRRIVADALIPDGTEVPPELTKTGGDSWTRELLAQIGILWPGITPTTTVPPEQGPIMPPYRLVSVPALTRDDILDRLDALRSGEADEEGVGGALDLLYSYADTQDDVDLLWSRYGNSQVSALIYAFRAFGARGKPPSTG